MDEEQEVRPPGNRVPLADLQLAYPPREWMTKGLCGQPEFIREHGYDFMFPSDFGPSRVARQVEVCSRCPVSVMCGEAGENEPWGIWGGETRRDRLARGAGRGEPFDPDTGRVMFGAPFHKPK
jgi:hypothetical protein